MAIVPRLFSQQEKQLQRLTSNLQYKHPSTLCALLQGSTHNVEVFEFEKALRQLKTHSPYFL